MDKKYFKEIFNLEATIHEGHRDKRIDYAALQNIFTMVGFEPTEKQTAEFRLMFEKCQGTMNFTEFLNVFSLKSNPQFSETDVKNAFRLLSKEYERPNQIKLERIKQILNEMGIPEDQIYQLTTQLQGLCDKDGYFDFEKFVKEAF